MAEENIAVEITAKEGMYLTQVSEVSDGDRVYCTKALMPKGNESLWRDATQQEYDEWSERVENESEEFEVFNE
jgi:hypothetical protein